jgi:STE24 endopeptidase
LLPIPLIVALILAFGVGPAADAASRPVLSLPLRTSLLGVGLTLALVGAISGLAGAVLARRSGPDAAAGHARPWRRLARTSVLLDGLNLAAFTWMIFGLGWLQVVQDGLGLKSAVLLDEVLDLAPFVIGQVAVWAALVPAERRLYPSGAPIRLRSIGASLVRRIRAGFGLVLPGVLLYSLATDLIARYGGGEPDGSLESLAGVGLIGALILIGAPLFVRLAWPTRRLEDGPLRQRLEQTARRLGFPYADILVWDTDMALLNAGITGTLPRFRYILLTDRLIDQLEPAQVEAVFGHEIGHVAHRHLPFFALFFLGSIGLMALVGQAFDTSLTYLPYDWAERLSAGPWPQVLEWMAVGLSLAVLGLYIYVVFGRLSRRFERQADVYGCRAISCGDPDCPILDSHDPTTASSSLAERTICPSAIRTFSEALWFVAILNGIDPKAPSWRHGSIQGRIDFLSQLDGHPEVERRFQTRVRRLRLALACGLGLGLMAALATGALAHL